MHYLKVLIVLLSWKSKYSMLLSMFFQIFSQHKTKLLFFTVYVFDFITVMEIQMFNAATNDFIFLRFFFS